MFGSYLLSLVLMLCFSSHLLSESRTEREKRENRERHDFAKTIWSHPKALESFATECARQPILEILYAWAGYDIWEGATANYKDSGNNTSISPTLTSDKGSTDVTSLIREALNNGGLYIQRAPATTTTTWVAAPASAHLPAGSTVGPVTIRRDQPGSPISKESVTVGICYRDARGIHFRRFESWQNIVLPAPTGMVCTQNPGSQGGAGYYYAHQLEENGTRGLITLSAQGSPSLVLMATDRLAMHQSTNSIETAFSSFASGPRGQGMCQPWMWNGLDWHGWTSHENNLFTTHFHPNGLDITLQNNFGWRTENDYNEPHEIKYRYNYSNRHFYDANGTLQMIAGGDLDPSLRTGATAIKYPQSQNALDLWYAFDNTTFSMGTGKPNSEADITAGANNTRTLVTRTIPYARYLRYFGFRSGQSGHSSTLSFIDSKVLNPATKFCTPPHLRGNFLFWRNEWTAPTKDFLSLQFKARGDCIMVALGQKTMAERAATNPFDTSYSYALRVTPQEIRVEKQNATTLIPVTKTPGAFNMIGTDKEAINDYWLTFVNGTLTFGHGTTVGQNIVAVAVDPSPLQNNTTFCFSSRARSVDYTGITCNSYQLNSTSTTSTIAQKPEDLGSFTQWPNAQMLQAVDQGAILFSYRNNTSTPVVDTHAVMIGLRATLPTAAEITNKTAPDYQILLGSRANTSHEILRQTTPVKLGRRADNSGILPLNQEWQDMWLLYSSGSIAYGTGSQIGSNMLGSWSDPTPLQRMRYFSFTSFAPTMEFRLNGTPALEPQRVCSTQHGTAPKWATLWQFETPNQGAFTFSAIAATAAGTIQVGLTNATQSYPPYEVIINDTGKAYIRKDRLQQTNSITTLTEDQLPTGTPKQYWIAYKNGNILVGTGSNPLATGALILQWQDPAFNPATTPAISRFVFSSANATLQYSNIGIQPFDAYNTALTMTSQNLQAQSAAQAQWIANPTELLLPASPIKQLYWHPTLRFIEPGKTIISATVQKKDTNPCKIMIGLNDALIPAETPVLPLSSAAISITLAESGVIEIRSKNGTLLHTSPVCPALQKLADSTPHNLWCAINTVPQGIVCLFGLDTPLGASPFYTHTIPLNLVQIQTLTYFGLGADNSGIAITAIRTERFNDATTHTTTPALRYTWQPAWNFAEADQAQISFTIAAQQPNKLVFAFGLGTSAAGTTPNNIQLNDAAYTLVIDYTGQIYLLKSPDLITKIGQVRYSDLGDMQKHTEVLRVASTLETPCTISYDRGRFLVQIGTTPVWSYVDTNPLSDITKFSFASLDSVSTLTQITARSGALMRTIEQLMTAPQDTLSTDSSAFITTLQTVLAERLHLKNLSYLFSAIIPVIASNHELFTSQQKVQLVALLRDINAEPTVNQTQKTIVTQLIASLTNPIDYQALLATYAEITPTIIGSANLQQNPLPQTDARRLLYFKKLEFITRLPNTETSKAAVLSSLQNLLTLLSATTMYTQSEQDTIEKLKTLSSNETILAHSQDPDSILKTIQAILDKNSQTDALLAFITKRHQARLVPATVPVPLTNQQASMTLDIIASLVDNRDELTEVSQKNCMLIMQLAKASPDLAIARTTQNPQDQSVRTIDQLTVSLNQPIPLAARIQKLRLNANSMILRPSTDPVRRLFFNGLTNLTKSIAGITPPDMATIQNDIVAPFAALNLPADELEIINALKTNLSSLESENFSFKAQIKFMQKKQALMKGYIEALISMLQGKGISTQFAPDDFEVFLAQIEYAVDSRELIDAQDLPQLISLIKIMQLTPEFAPYASELTTLLAEAKSEHTFADRIAYAKEELALIIKRRNADAQKTLLTEDVYYLRLIEKLRRLMTAPGIKTDTLFTDLEANVLNPLLALTSDAGQRAALQEIRATLLSNKAQIIEAQKTFSYHFAAATEQKTNTSMYISMLKNIIENERNGLIIFNNATNGSAASSADSITFITALTDVVALRDTLSATDLTTLQTAINYALYSKAFADAELKKRLTTLYDTASKPTPFEERVKIAITQTQPVISLLPSDPMRIAFMKHLNSLIDAPGQKSTEVLTMLQENVLNHFNKTVLNEDEKNIISQLNTLTTTQQASLRTASFQMNQLAMQPDFATYINGLHAIFTGKGTRVTFNPDDYKTFVEHLQAITVSRELLSGQLLAVTQELINSALLSAEFTQFSTELTACNTQIKQPFYFNDRVAALSAEVKILSARNATADDALLSRVCAKLDLILLAPQLNTTDKEFNDFELNVLSPLSRLALSDDQKARLERVRTQIRSQKAQILASQTTFRYHFNFAQVQKDSTDAYIASLRNIMQKQREGAITFMGTDSSDLLASLKELVTNRDELTPEQLTTVRALVNFCAYSTIYKDTPDAATLISLYEQTTQPIAIAQLIIKYITQLGSILAVPSTHMSRIKYFTQLENLTQHKDSLTPTLVQDVNAKIITPLKEALFNLGGAVDSREAAIIQKLESYISLAGRKAQSVSYLLQIADDTNINLFDYAQAVCAIMQQKGTTIVFTPDDVVKTMGALSYIATSRELLKPEQIVTLQQFIAQIIWLGTFAEAATQLQSISDMLESLYTFSDRIKNASQELRVMILGQTSPTSNRMVRFIERLKIMLQATGPATPADFNTLQNTIIAPLQRLALPDAQKQIIADINVQVTTNKDAILAAQKTFTYNFQQAQLIQENLSNYITALQNIITLKRQDLLTFEFADYRTFIDALIVVGDQRDALTIKDLNNLKNTVNYTYHSTGFAENAQYQRELTALNNTLNVPVTFALRVNEYTRLISKILQLDSANIERKRFFNRIKLLPNLEGSGEITEVEKLANTILAPLQNLPLISTEQAVIQELNEFVSKIRSQASLLSYNLQLLLAQIVQAQTDPTKNSIDVLINGLNDIIIKRNSGSIIFSNTDYAPVIEMVKNLVDNRELFNDGQISRVQSLIRAIQFGAGFEAYKAALDALYKTTATPLTFAERITKYRASLPQMNSSPTENPSKNEFINMITSIFNAPGDRTLDMLTTLESEILNPIKFGNFTPAQKQKIEPLSMRLAVERTKLNSFAYRFGLAQSETTLEGFYQALTSLITDYTNATVTFGIADYAIFLSELEQYGALRPLSTQTQSALYSLVQMTKTAPVFATRIDLVERLNALSTQMSTPADPAIRAQYFIQTTMSILSRVATDGQRNRYFALVAQFSSELSILPADRINTAIVKTALTSLQTAFNQYRVSANATEAEKNIMNDLIRQLQDLLLTPSATISQINTSTPTPTAPTTSSTTIPRAPTTARFYRSVPSSRFAQ
jgi:hypothetical protein